MAVKNAGNCDGAYYVDDHCINCSLCAVIAPEIFATNHDDGYEYVKKQPETENEIALVAEAMESCPADAIRDNSIRN